MIVPVAWVIGCLTLICVSAKSIYDNVIAKEKRQAEWLEKEKSTRAVSDFEGCKVYRFYDRGFRYYTHCKDGSTPTVENKK